MSGRRLPALLLTAAVLLGGCASGAADEPRRLEPVASASPSASASAAPDGETAVLAAVDAYYAAVNTAYASGDTAVARALVTPDCPCVAQLDDIDAFTRRGDRVTGSAYSASAVRVAALAPPTAVVELTTDITAGELRDRTGKTTERVAASVVPQRLTLLLQDGSWKVRDVTRRDR